MRLGGRLAAAIEVLEDMERRKRPAADALKDWGLSHRFAGSGDRSAIGNIVYDALRRRRSAGWLTGDDSPRGQAFGALLLEWGMTPESLNAALEGDRFAPEPLAGRDLTAITARDPAFAPHAVRADIPDWTIPHFQAAFGDDWVAEGEALATRPPLDMRVNTLLSDREKVAAEIEGGPRPTAIAPDGLRIAPIELGGRHPNVQVEPAFQKGWFEIQDEGSQIVSGLSGAAGGMQVLDYCAGAGGKTLALSAMMENKGQIFAHDSEKARLAPIFDRLKRAECRNVQVIANASALEALDGQMDLVLVDAPCTGSGTWRRRPDAKWRLSPRQLEVRMNEQRAILDAVTRFVKPGGAIAYITCSVFREENQDQVNAFAGRHPDFVIADHKAFWNARFSHTTATPRTDPEGIILTPATTSTDGFFFSFIERKG